MNMVMSVEELAQSSKGAVWLNSDVAEETKRNVLRWMVSQENKQH
jgi:hypothetical protein